MLGPLREVECLNVRSGKSSRGILNRCTAAGQFGLHCFPARCINPLISTNHLSSCLFKSCQETATAIIWIRKLLNADACFCKRGIFCLSLNAIGSHPFCLVWKVRSRCLLCMLTAQNWLGEILVVLFLHCRYSVVAMFHNQMSYSLDSGCTCCKLFVQPEQWLNTGCTAWRLAVHWLYCLETGCTLFVLPGDRMFW